LKHDLHHSRKCLDLLYTSSKSEVEIERSN
jgi:hypothetical protein